MSLNPKKVVLVSGAAVAVVASLVFGGPAALAAEAPTGTPSTSNSDATPQYTAVVTATPAAAAPAASTTPTTTTEPATQEATPAAPTPSPAPAAPETAPAAPAAAPTPAPEAPAEPAANPANAPASAPAAAPQTVKATQPPQPVQPPVETCVSDAKTKFSHVVDYSTGATVITVTGGKTDEPICSPLNVSIALYAYTKANSVWPQELVDVLYIYIDKVGVFSYNPGFTSQCRQIDWYASKNGLNGVIPSAILTGPGQPYEHDFLHQYSTGRTTYNQSSAYNCAGKPEVPPSKVVPTDTDNFACGITEVTVTHTVTTTPYKVVFENGTWKIVPDTDNITTVVTTSTRPPTSAELAKCPVTETGTATFTVQICDVESRNWISAEAVPGGIWSISDGNGHTQDLAGIGEGYEGGLPDGLAYGTTYTVSLRDGNSEDLYVVTPWSGTWTPVDASTECQPKVAYAHASPATQATCDANSTTEFMIEHATWQTPAETKPGDWVRVAIADEGYVFPTMSEKGSTTEEVGYTIKPALGHQSTDVNAPCYVKPPVTTPTPTPTPTPPTTVTGEQQPPTSQSQTLAKTGLDISTPLEIGGALALVVGLGLLLFRRRRQAASDNE